MTSTHHGLATLTVEPHHGHIEVRIDVGTVHVIMSDREFRDVLRCARDEYVSMFQWPLPEPVKPHPGPGADEARRCDHCGHKLAQIFDGDRGWCGIECQVNDRRVVRCPLFARDDCDATFTDRPAILDHLQGWPHYRTREEAETVLGLAEEVAP